jgi:hypothetical protein
MCAPMCLFFSSPMQPNVDLSGEMKFFFLAGGVALVIGSLSLAAIALKALQPQTTRHSNNTDTTSTEYIDPNRTV